MPRLNGFELLSELDGLDFQVIFVTAYNEYAVAALKKSAIGYILKPVDDDDLKHAITKSITTIREKQQQTHRSSHGNHFKKKQDYRAYRKRAILYPSGRGAAFGRFSGLYQISFKQQYRTFKQL